MVARANYKYRVLISIFKWVSGQNKKSDLVKTESNRPKKHSHP